MLREYKTALLIHTDGYVGVKALVVDPERQAFLDGYYKAFAMGAGPCNLCETCSLEDEEYHQPEKARPAMEACGIDVYQTARNHGLPIEVVADGTCAQNYYGIVLLE